MRLFLAPFIFTGSYLLFDYLDLSHDLTLLGAAIATLIIPFILIDSKKERT